MGLIPKGTAARLPKLFYHTGRESLRFSFFNSFKKGGRRMDRQEIREAFQRELDVILDIYEQLDKTTDPQVKAQLERRKRELIQLQIEYIEMLHKSMSS